MTTDKKIETLLGTFKLTPTQAVWVLNLSDKHAFWIAKQINANKEIYPKEAGRIKKIIEWKKEDTIVDITKHTFSQMLSIIEKAERRSFKIIPSSLKNENVVAVCDGSEFKWVEIKTEEEALEEGEAMSNCLRNYPKDYIGRGKRLFSLRDINNRPRVTLYIVKDEIIEYKGFANKEVEESYNDFLSFLEKEAKVKIDDFSKYRNGLIKGKLQVPQKIKGDFYIRHDDHFEFPKGFEVTGDLLVHGNHTLPLELKVGGNLFIEEANEQVILPIGLKVGKNLIIGEDEQLAVYVNVSEYTSVVGNLNIFSKGYTVIDNNVKIGKNLNIDEYDKVCIFEDVNVGGNVDIDCSTLEISSGLNVGGNVDINSGYVQISSGLNVGGNLDIKADGGYVSVSKGVNVGGNLNIESNEDIKISSGLNVGGVFYVATDSDFSVPNGVTIGKDLIITDKCEFTSKVSISNGVKINNDLSITCKEVNLSNIVVGRDLDITTLIDYKLKKGTIIKRNLKGSCNFKSLNIKEVKIGGVIMKTEV